MIKNSSIFKVTYLDPDGPGVCVRGDIPIEMYVVAESYQRVLKTLDQKKIHQVQSIEMFDEVATVNIDCDCYKASHYPPLTQDPPPSPKPIGGETEVTTLPKRPVGLYAPVGLETGTDFVYKDLADQSCPECQGWGEFHVPYDDYDTYIIHRCDCTRDDE